MPIPLPNLDDRTFADLAEEMRALIPRYAPAWTDHNTSDPGITLIELFAWLTEALIYRLNRIPEASEARFLELLGATFEPARPAKVTLNVTANGLEEAMTVPRGTPLTTIPGEGSERLPFEILHDLELTPEAPSGSTSARQTAFVHRERLGTSDGQAHQVLQLAGSFLILETGPPSLIVPGVEVDGVAWTFVSSLLDSAAEGKHFATEPRLNAIRFGDGRLGQIPPEGVEITASYLYTLGKRGNVPAGTEFKIDAGSNLVASGLRQALDSDSSFSIRSEADASGGTDPTDLEQARDEATGALKTRWRAVTAQDFEDLVVEQAGLNVARAKCFPEWDLAASDPYTARPGHVSVIVVPSLDDKAEDDRPELSPEIITDVWDFLNRRRLITCRHHVVSPHYTDARVRAEVVCIPRVSREDVEAQIMANLQEFFHPLRGGPDRNGEGWPFGRDVYASEVYQVIEETEGVDHVESLTLYAQDESGDWQEADDRVAVEPINLVHFDVQYRRVIARANR
jgi:hypothetical protein